MHADNADIDPVKHNIVFGHVVGDHLAVNVSNDLAVVFSNNLAIIVSNNLAIVDGFFVCYYISLFERVINYNDVCQHDSQLVSIDVSNDKCFYKRNHYTVWICNFDCDYISNHVSHDKCKHSRRCRSPERRQDENGR